MENGDSNIARIRRPHLIPSPTFGYSSWSGGRIYNPEDGKTYKCKLTLQDDGTLKVRGYVGMSIFGKTQIWRRLR